MWVFTKIGMFSCVETFKNAEVLQVRARAKEDIEALRPYVGKKMKVIRTPNRDYEFRIFIAKKKWAAIMAQLVMEIDYTNFKDKVAQVQGKERAHVYMNVWCDGLAIGKKSNRRLTQYSYGYDYEPRSLWKDDQRTSYGDYDGRSPVPDHWASAKQRQRKAGSEHPTNQGADSKLFDSSREPIHFTDTEDWERDAK